MIDPKAILREVTYAKPTLATHYKTLDILEGNLEPYVLKCLEKQLSPRVFSYAEKRLVPINIIPRYIEKRSNIYQTGVTREVVDGAPADQELLSWYENQLQPNKAMHLGNKLYNACKSCLIHPYMSEDEGPKLRIIPNDRFVVVGEDPSDPLKVTKVILIAGQDSNGKEIYWVYTDQEFAIVKSDETIDYAAMEAMGLDGANRFGALPFVYANSSALLLNPNPDTDSLRMAEYIPIALTDLNLAAMFSAFSITYVTNGNIENLTYAPNALWFLTPTEPDKEPTLGTLKPEVDYQEVLNLIQTELSLWLGSKGIKTGAVGQLTPDAASSGIAKMIDEADTYDVRQEQTVHFQEAESALWDLILHKMHPIWAAEKSVTMKQMFSASAKVKTKFTVTPVGTMRSQLIQDQKEEFAAGFTTRTRAIAALNPQMTMDEVEALEAEIDSERIIKVESETNNEAGSTDNASQMAENQNTSTGNVREQERSEENS